MPSKMVIGIGRAPDCGSGCQISQTYFNVNIYVGTKNRPHLIGYGLLMKLFSISHA